MRFCISRKAPVLGKSSSQLDYSNPNDFCGLELVLMRAGFALLLLGLQKDFSMQCLRGMDKGRELVKVWICASQLLDLFVQVFFQVVKSHGRSFLKLTDPASAFSG